MKNSLLSGAVLLELSAAPLAPSCDSSGGGSDNYSDGVSWQNLFNGKNLNGWHQLNGHAEYTVENGEIVGTTVANTPIPFWY
jgi:hypothetical protein